MGMRNLFLFIFSFLFFLIQLQAKSSSSSELSQMKACSGELFNYVDIEPVSPKIVNETFTVRATCARDGKKGYYN
jgi:hypothetical protein